MPQISLSTIGLRAFDSDGDSVAGAFCYVYEEGTTTPVTTYSDEALTTPQAHPVVADSGGGFASIYIPAGTYKIDVTDSGGSSLTGFPKDNLAVTGASVDPLDIADVTALLADTDFTYTTGLVGTVASGDLIRTRREGYAYEVQASGATIFDQSSNTGGYHIATAGGVKLRYTPSDGAFDLAALGVGDGSNPIEAMRIAAQSTVRDIYIPPGAMVLTSTTSQAHRILVPRSKTWHGAGRDVCSITLAPTAAPLEWRFPDAESIDIESPADNTVQDISLIRSHDTAPTEGGLTFYMARFSGTAKFLRVNETGANSFGLAIFGSQYAHFECCRAVDHYGGKSGALGTDGMHSGGNKYARFFDNYVNGCGDDGLSAGANVDEATIASPFSSVDSAVFRGNRVENVAGAGIKAYCRVYNLLVEANQIINADSYGVSLSLGDTTIVTVPDEAVYIRDVTIRDNFFDLCRGLNTANTGECYGGIGNVIRASVIADDRPFRFGQLNITGNIFDRCTRAVHVGRVDHIDISHNVVKNQDFQPSGATGEYAVWSIYNTLNFYEENAVVRITNNDILDAVQQRNMVLLSGGMKYGVPGLFTVENNTYRDGDIGNANVILGNAHGVYSIKNNRMSNLLSGAGWFAGSGDVDPKSEVFQPLGNSGTNVGINFSGNIRTYLLGPSATISAALTAGTHYKGSVYAGGDANGEAVTGQPSGWRVKTSGTFGTLSGVTATGTSGEKVVTLSDVSDVYVGHVISISALSIAAIIEIAEDGTCKISGPLTADATAAAVSFVAPVFTALANYA